MQKVNHKFLLHFHASSRVELSPISYTYFISQGFYFFLCRFTFLIRSSHHFKSDLDTKLSPVSLCFVSMQEVPEVTSSDISKENMEDSYYVDPIFPGQRPGCCHASRGLKRWNWLETISEYISRVKIRNSWKILQCLDISLLCFVSSQVLFALSFSYSRVC